MTFENFTIALDDDGIALVVFNVPNRTMNTITVKVLEELPILTARLKEDPAVKAIVLTSGKANGFCAGADLGEMGSNELVGAGAASAEAQLKRKFDSLYLASRAFRGFEACGKPLAAAIEGLALGGGLEWLLGCCYRVVANNPKILLGLPESKLGLLPGGGGTQRLPRILGIEKAFAMISEGRLVGPAEALKLGIVHQVVAAGETVSAAKAWIKNGGEAGQPWDKKGFKLPGGGPYDGGGEALQNANGQIRQKFFGNYPAQVNILKCIYEGCQLPMDTALKTESRYMLLTMDSPQAKAMVRSMFLSPQELTKAPARPKEIAKTEFKSVAILGHGPLAAAIAQMQLAADVETIFLGFSQAEAIKGRADLERHLGQAVAASTLPAAKAEQYLAQATIAGPDGLEADLVILLKSDLAATAGEAFGKALTYVTAAPVFAPPAAAQPGFIGLHFALDPARASFIEITRDNAATDEDLAKAIDYALRFRKTPIISGAGGYMFRTLLAYIDEGICMLAEGIAPAIIENAGRMTSMPRGPLETADALGLDILWPGSKAPTAVQHLLARGRSGRAERKGFYEYPDAEASYLWRGLANIFPVETARLPLDEIEKLKLRLLMRQSLEAAHCCETEIIDDPRAADIGAILGWEFATWTGGPLSFIDMLGSSKFLQCCEDFSVSFGERFAPPQLLRTMAISGKSFYKN